MDVLKIHMAAQILDLLKFQRYIKIDSFYVCLKYFVWYFKGDISNSTQNIFETLNNTILIPMGNLKSSSIEELIIVFQLVPRGHKSWLSTN